MERYDAKIPNITQDISIEENAKVCTALTFGAANLRKDEFNGDAILAYRLSNGGYLTAAADAANHKKDSYLSSQKSLQILLKVVEEKLPLLQNEPASFLFIRILAAFHETALKEGEGKN